MLPWRNVLRLIRFGRTNIKCLTCACIQRVQYSRPHEPKDLGIQGGKKSVLHSRDQCTDGCLR
jgi:hypothetical protein